MRAPATVVVEAPPTIIRTPPATREASVRQDAARLLFSASSMHPRHFPEIRARDWCIATLPTLFLCYVPSNPTEGQKAALVGATS